MFVPPPQYVLKMKGITYREEESFDKEEKGKNA
jgi:hypothetical protein